jgi:8-oxo-dGTP pyrophosphatase MutT (NUDIX family)
MADFFLNEGHLRPSHAAVALIIVGERPRYLMQLRDQKPGIFYPGHWGLFGGAIDPGEVPESTLQRELAEELRMGDVELTYFTEFEFDFSFCGYGRLIRRCYEVRVADSALPDLVLGEGTEMRLFSAAEILAGPRVAPYDALAIWLHASKHSTLQNASDLK